MKSSQVYPVIYVAVKKYIKYNVPPNDGLKRFWEFAKIIPHYSKVNNIQANALCTSVSHCKEIGLEAFYQINIDWDFISSLIMKKIIDINETEMLELRNFFYDENLEHKYKIVLGDFVRHFFEGRRVMSKEDEAILAKI